MLVSSIVFEVLVGVLISSGHAHESATAEMNIFESRPGTYDVFLTLDGETSGLSDIKLYMKQLKPADQEAMVFRYNTLSTFATNVNSGFTARAHGPVQARRCST